MLLVDGLLNYAADWEWPHVLLFTGNPVINNRGGVVMGRGAAKQVRDTYQGIDVMFADMIQADPDETVHILDWHGKPLGWFQVKHHWREEADLHVIEQAVARLCELAREYPEAYWHLNFPGIGNGKLCQDDVMPLLAQLPDSVKVYR